MCGAGALLRLPGGGLDGFGAAVAAGAGAPRQLMAPMVLAPYCTYPVPVGGECWAVNGV